MAASVATDTGYTESGAAGTTHTKTGITTTGGNGIAVAIAVHGGLNAVSSVTDSAGNTYRRHGGNANSTTADVEIWATTAAAPTALASGTVTVTTTGSAGVAFHVYEITGARMPLTSTVVNANANGSSTSPSSGATGASRKTTDLTIGAIAAGQTETFSSIAFTAGAGTDHNDPSTTTGSVCALESSSKALATAAAQTYSATINSSGSWAAVIVRFEGSGDSFSEIDSATAARTRTKSYVKTFDFEVLEGQLIPAAVPTIQPT